MADQKEKMLTLAQALKVDKEATEEDYKYLSKAKIDVMSRENSSFFSYVMLGLVHEFYVPIPGFETAGTDGFTVAYNRHWFSPLTAPQRTGLSLHETLHVAFKHMFRFDMWDDWCPDKANQAADHVINNFLKEWGFELPPGGLCDPKFKGMSWEEVYKILMANPPPQQQQPQQQPQLDIFPAGSLSGRLPGEGSDKDEGESGQEGGQQATMDKMSTEIDDLLIQAVLNSRANGDKPGSIPGDVERYVDQLLNPRVPWNRVLSSVMTKICKNDYSLRRPNRRYMPDFYLPTLYTEKICDVAVSVDISASITDEQFQHFISETAAIIGRLKPDKTTFFQWDTRIVEPIYEVKSLRDLSKVEFHGGGGTNVQPAIDWARDNKPDIYIIFTDGYFDPPAYALKMPVIWVVHSNPTYVAPFGKTITYDFE